MENGSLLLERWHTHSSSRDHTCPKFVGLGTKRSRLTEPSVTVSSSVHDEFMMTYNYLAVGHPQPHSQRLNAQWMQSTKKKHGAIMLRVQEVHSYSWTICSVSAQSRFSVRVEPSHTSSWAFPVPMFGPKARQTRTNFRIWTRSCPSDRNCLWQPSVLRNGNGYPTDRYHALISYGEFQCSYPCCDQLAKYSMIIRDATPDFGISSSWCGVNFARSYDLLMQDSNWQSQLRDKRTRTLTSHCLTNSSNCRVLDLLISTWVVAIYVHICR